MSHREPRGTPQWRGPAMTFRAVYPALPVAVREIRTMATRFAANLGAADGVVDAVALAVSEAATNVVVHAYDEPGQAEIEVMAGVASGRLWVIVADRGSGLRASTTRPGLGLGLRLIARLSDAFEVTQRVEGGLELRMGFDLAGDDSG